MSSSYHHHHQQQNLSALPGEVWSLISDYTTAPAAERNGLGTQKTCLSSLRCTSRVFNSLLTSEEYYMARVADAIKTLDELDNTRRTGSAAAADTFNSFGRSSRASTSWPCAESVGGYKNLFHILVSWAPLEGWFTLLDAWPWGFLVLMKFCDGMLCGEVVSVSQQDNSSMAQLDGYDCHRNRIFEISFDSSGNANCTVLGKKAESFGIKWKGGSTDSSSYHKVKKSDVFRSLQIRNDFSDEDVFPRNDGLLFQISRILKNDGDDDTNSLHHTEPFFSDMSEVNNSINAPTPTCSDIIETLLQREVPVYKYKQNIRQQSYVNRLQDYYPNGLLFEYVCGPEGRPLGYRAKASKGMFRNPQLLPHPLKPGFYAGKNDRRHFQHHLRYEVVQVRNHQLHTASRNEADEIMLSFQESIKASKTDSLPSIVDLVKSNNRGRFAFVSGRKITGDINVPTGELSWVAITSTLRDVADFPTPPVVLINGRQCHQVTNAWPGWKQVARPFYCDSSWKKGWLLELRGTMNADDEWNEGFKYCDEAQYVFWLPDEQLRNYFIISKLPCHFGSYLWDA